MILFLWIVNLFVIYYEWKKSSVAAIMWGVIFLIFTIPNTIHYFDNVYSLNNITEATIFSISFMMVYLITRTIYFLKVPESICQMDKFNININELDKIDLYFYLYICSFIIVYIFFMRRGQSILLTKAYESYSLSSFELLFRVVFISLSGVGFLCLISKKYIKFILSAVAIIIYFMLTQIRYNLIGYFAAFMIFFIFNKNKKLKIQGVMIGIAFIFLVFFTQQVRWAGGIGNAIDMGFISLFEKSAYQIKAGNGEFGLIKAFYFFIENDNNFRGFGEGNGFIRLFLIFLPSGIAPFKPRDFAIDMYREWFGVDLPNGTMHPTLFGDAYANFGYYGFLVGIFFATFFIIFDLIVLKEKSFCTKIIKLSIIFTMMVLLARGAIYNSIFNCIVGLAVVVIIEIVSKLWRNDEDNTSKWIR